MWTGGADELETFHSVWQYQPVVHWIVNPTPNTGYNIFGGSNVIALYPYKHLPPGVGLRLVIVLLVFDNCIRRFGFGFL